MASIDTAAADQPGPAEPQVAPPRRGPGRSRRSAPGRGQRPGALAARRVAQATAKLQATDGSGPHSRRRCAGWWPSTAWTRRRIPATGPGGRITKGDVLQHLEAASGGQGGARPPPRWPWTPRPPPCRWSSTPAPAALATIQTVAPEAVQERETRVKMSRLRHRIAERLVAAQQTAAILTTFNEADMSPVMAFRARHKDSFEKKLRRAPGLHVASSSRRRWTRSRRCPSSTRASTATRSSTNHYYDIGVAVSTEQGLIVPVIRDADRLSFAEIEAQIVDFADARPGAKADPGRAHRRLLHHLQRRRSTARCSRRRSSTRPRAASSACTRSKSARWWSTTRS